MVRCSCNVSNTLLYMSAYCATVTITALRFQLKFYEQNILFLFQLFKIRLFKIRQLNFGFKIIAGRKKYYITFFHWTMTRRITENYNVKHMRYVSSRPKKRKIKFGVAYLLINRWKSLIRCDWLFIAEKKLKFFTKQFTSFKKPISDSFFFFW